MSVQTVSTAKAPAAIGPYSQATIAGGFLFTAGQIPLDPVTMKVIDGDVVAQAERVLANLSAVLTQAGCGWSDVVKTTVFLQDMADFPRFNEVYAAVLGEARPARSTVQVAALPRGVSVEIDAIAKLAASVFLPPPPDDR
ncbi:MAG: RidA family protein [Gemmatimonadetes bacterium]|nr:RidA family protein [Gemmatimonadota bacterium]